MKIYLLLTVQNKFIQIQIKLKQSDFFFNLKFQLKKIYEMALKPLLVNCINRESLI